MEKMAAVLLGGSNKVEGGPREVSLDIPAKEYNRSSQLAVATSSSCCLMYHSYVRKWHHWEVISRASVISAS